MNIAKRSGSILSYDPNLRLPLWPSEDAARSGIMSVWNLADIIKVLLFSQLISALPLKFFLTMKSVFLHADK